MAMRRESRPNVDQPDNDQRMAINVTANKTSYKMFDEIKLLPVGLHAISDETMRCGKGLYVPYIHSTYKQSP